MQTKRPVIVRLLLTLGFVALLVLGLRAAFNGWQETAHRVPCAGNLKSIGQLIYLYAEEHEGNFPEKLEELFGDPNLSMALLICPNTSDKQAHAANPAELRAKLTSIGRPGDYALAAKRPALHMSYIYCGAGFTTRSPADVVVAYEPLSNHDGDGIDALYADGHVMFIIRAEAEYLIAELQAGHNPPRAHRE